MIASLCLKMTELGASDLFLSAGRPPAMRRAGQVIPVPDARILTEEDCQDFFQRHLPPATQEKLRQQLDLDLGVNLGDGTRFRLNLSFQRGNTSLAIRKVPSGRLRFQELHLPDCLGQLAETNHGLILVTGPTGCGKSTTLAALLNHINATLPRHIVTIEDPIEFVHDDDKSVVSQREIGSDTHDFASALRHVVRQNPDAIFLGELRDLETVSTALSAALTGHLVAATMHTLDAVQTIERLINYYPDGLRDQVAIDLANALCGVFSQRLLTAKDGASRYPAYELLLGTPLARRLIARRELDDLQALLADSGSQGMMDFSHSILELLRNDVITFETGLQAAPNKESFRLLAQGMNTGIDTLRQYSADPEQGFNIRKLLRDAAHYGASDLLLSAGAPPMLRLNGVLRPLDMPVLTAADTQKLLFSVLTPRQRTAFEAEREIDFALSVKGMTSDNKLDLRFRVNGFYQKGKIACAFRLIPMNIPNPQALGLPPLLEELAQKPQGLILVTGPTGHGKSTTLAAIVDMINCSRACHVITIEDPIEFVHANKKALIEQREVHADTRSFHDALKYVLRQDPDVILIGEMRDAETISAALTAAETGHLVLATLHTNDTAQSIDRIIDVFDGAQQNQIRAQLAASLEAIIAQRLLPRANSKGRVAAFEILIGTTAVRALIRDKRTHQIASAIESSAKDGMVTMDRSLKLLLEAGEITPRTYLKYAKNPSFS